MLQLKWNSGKLHNTFFTHCYSQTFTSPTFLTHCWTFRWECVKLYQIRHQSDRTPNWKLVSAAVSHWDQHSVPQTSRPGFVLYNSSRCFLFLNVTKKKRTIFFSPSFPFSLVVLILSLCIFFLLQSIHHCFFESWICFAPTFSKQPHTHMRKQEVCSTLCTHSLYPPS